MSKSAEAALRELFAAAKAAQANAYAPYSRFHVGAALRSESGAIHAGCNVENAAYPQGSCAEAGAISAMALAGEPADRRDPGHRRRRALCTPCGGCRQRIREFADSCDAGPYRRPRGRAARLHPRRASAAILRPRSFIGVRKSAPRSTLRPGLVGGSNPGERRAVTFGGALTPPATAASRDRSG